MSHFAFYLLAPEVTARKPLSSPYYTIAFAQTGAAWVSMRALPQIERPQNDRRRGSPAANLPAKVGILISNGAEIYVV